MSRLDDLDPTIDDLLDEALADEGPDAATDAPAGSAPDSAPEGDASADLDLESGLAAIERLVADARVVPMSASALINRDEALELVRRVRANVPAELREARRIALERETVLASARREADRLVANADADRSTLLDRTEVVRAAATEADRLLADARDEAARARGDVDDYVDAKLASFEAMLLKTLGAVQKGRQRLTGSEDDGLGALGDG